MKKVFLLVLASLLAFDPADAQLAFSGGSGNHSLPGLSQADEMSMLKKRKKKKRKSSGKKRGRSSGPAIGVGPGFFIGFPMGDFADAVKTGMGFNVDADFFPNSSFSVGINTGMYSFKYDVESNEFFKFNKSTFSIIPMCVKASYYFMDGAVQPYAGLNVGMFVNKSKLNYDEQYIFLNQATNEMDSIWLTSEQIDMTTDFGIAPMAGALFQMSDKLFINANLRYDMIFTEETNTTLFGINLGLYYKF